MTLAIFFTWLPVRNFRVVAVALEAHQRVDGGRDLPGFPLVIARAIAFRSIPRASARMGS